MLYLFLLYSKVIQSYIYVYIQLLTHTYTRTHICVPNRFSRLQLSAPPWTAARQGSVHGILQARMLEWVPCPPPGGLPDQGSSQVSMPPALAGRLLQPWRLCLRLTLFSITCHSVDSSPRAAQQGLVCPSWIEQLPLLVPSVRPPAPPP